MSRTFAEEAHACVDENHDLPDCAAVSDWRGGVDQLDLPFARREQGPSSEEKLWSHVAPFLVFSISLQVLLHVGNPPKTLAASVLFALLLLTLLLGLAGIVLVVSHLWEIA